MLGAALTCVSACWRSTGCRSRITRCSTCRRSRGRRRDRFFLCIEATRSAVRPRRRRAQFLEEPASAGSVTKLRRNAAQRSLVRWSLARSCARAGGAAARTCTTRRATSRSRRARSSPTAGRRGTLVANTVARGQLREDEQLYTGKRRRPARPTTFPMPVTAAVMARGQERFNVFCSPCHGRTGEGNGMIVQRGFRAAAVVPRGAAAQRAGRLLLRRDDQRLRRDAGLRRAGAGRRSLGDCRLHPRAAAEPARDAWTTCRPTAAPSSIGRRRRQPRPQEAR